MVTQPRAAADDWRAGLDPRAWPRPLLAALVPVIAALALYTRTLMPGLGLWDNAEFQTIGPVLGIAHPTGYPTYTLLAWLASVVLQPFGDPALRANLLSALLVAAAVGLVAGTVTMLTRRAFAGAAAGLAFAVASSAWGVALAADPHALHVFFVGLLLAMLVAWMRRTERGQRPAADRWLIAAAVVYGLSLGNHALTLLLAPGIAIFVFATDPGLLRRGRMIAACVAAVGLTTIAVYAYLPIRSAMDPPLDYANPQTLENFAYLVFGEQFRGTFAEMPDDALGRVLRSVASLNVIALLAPFGALFLSFRRPTLIVLLAAWFAVTWWFSLTYVNAAIERYYLGPLAVVAVLGGLGAAGLIDLLLSAGPFNRISTTGRRLHRSLPELSHSAMLRTSSRLGREAEARYGVNAMNRFVTGTLAALVLLVPVAVSVPGTLAQVDQSHRLDGRRWVESVLPQLGEGGVVISWWSFSTPLWYVQFVEGRRTDLTVIDDRTIIDRQLGSAERVINRYLGQRPVYLIRLDGDLPYYDQRYELEPLPGVLPMWGGHVYRVLGRKAGGWLQSAQ